MRKASPRSKRHCRWIRDRSSYHRDVGWHYFFQRRYDEAIEQLQRTLDQDPTYMPARTLRGRALIMPGRFDEGLGRAAPGGAIHAPSAALLFIA